MPVPRKYPDELRERAVRMVRGRARRDQARRRPAGLNLETVRNWTLWRHGRNVHKSAHFLSALPERTHPKAKRLLADIYTAETRSKAVESTFATVRLRQRVMKGLDCREAGVAMAYKLMDTAQDRWRPITAGELPALVRAATFTDGKLQEKSTEDADPTAEECAA